RRLHLERHRRKRRDGERRRSHSLAAVVRGVRARSRGGSPIVPVQHQAPHEGPNPATRVSKHGMLFRDARHTVREGLLPPTLRERRALPGDRTQPLVVRRKLSQRDDLPALRADEILRLSVSGAQGTASGAREACPEAYPSDSKKNGLIKIMGIG